MSDTILAGRWVVYYSVENRQKRIFRDIGVEPTVTDTVKALYSALYDLFDELTQIDDGTPMSYDTPTEYTIGIIDSGDKDPWFIDRQSAEYLKGGAIKTASWLRVEGSNTGIIRIAYTETVALVPSDIGKTIVAVTDGDSGTLLDYTSSPGVLWIRPDTYAAANSFDNATDTFTITGGTGTGSFTAISVTGESIWANIYTIVPLEGKTHLFAYQDDSLLTGYKTATDWWGDAELDILVNVREVGEEIDEGFLTVEARQYTHRCAYYIVNLTAGGRNPIPLTTGLDIDNTTGYREFTGSTGTGTFEVGEEISKSGTDKRAILTAVAGTGAAPELTYYLIGDPLTDFVNGDTSVTGENSGATCTAGTPADVGPAALIGLSIGHGADETFDIDEDETTENYSIVIDCNNNPLADVYEWTKYLTRRGETGTSNTDGIAGEQYIGSDYRILHGGITGTINEGDVVTQKVTLATGTIVALNTTDNIMILRNSRGIFSDTDQIYKTEDVDYVTPTSSVAIAPIMVAVFGTFAGGVFFCAPGVVLDNVPSADANNFQLVDDDGNVVKAPVKVTVLVGNTRVEDRISVFRLDVAGGVIKTDEYSATVQAIGATTLVVGESITADTVGKTAGGIIRLIDTDAAKKYRIRYSSWAGSTFTLASQTGLAAEGTDADTLTDAQATFQTWGILVGDIIRNVTEGVIAYVISVDSETQLTTTPVTDWTGDSYEINTLPVATETADDVYIPFIHVYEITGTDGSPGSEEVSVTYSTPIPVRIMARNAGDIKNFEADSTITSVGMVMAVIRSPDTVYE